MKRVSLFLLANAIGTAAAQTLPVPKVDTCPTVGRAPAGSYVEQTVLYETTVDGQSEYLDLYRPNGVVNPPMAMVVHGGGFVAGDKATGNALPLSLGLVALGWEVASINYRLSGANGFPNLFPAPLQDALCALQWLETNGGGDRNHVIVAGLSAGGGIVNWIGTIAQQPNSAWHSPTCQSYAATVHIAGVAAFYGFSNFASPDIYSSVAARDGWDRRVFGFTVETNSAGIIANSPRYNVTGSEPPFFMASGLSDTIIEPAQVANFAHTVQQAGVPANLLQAAGVGHGFNPFDSSLGPIPCTFVAWLDAIRLR